LNVFRSARHIYAQVVDDDRGCTVAACSTLDPQARSEIEGKEKAVAAGIVGALVARRALEKGVSEVTFDRGGYKYHGRVKSLAEAARGEGLTF
jgi:large subunit ribosomal protein L18